MENTLVMQEYLEKYMAIGSPSGYTYKIIEVIEKECQAMGIKTQLTSKGALILTIDGTSDENHRVITSHVDTLGGMVKEITGNGRLRFHKIGGGCWSAVEGENCTIVTADEREIRGSVVPDMASTHIHGLKPYNDKRDENNMTVRIDEVVQSKEDVHALGINVGDFIYYDTRTEVTDSGFIKSRYIDNKAAVAIVMSLCKKFAEESIQPKHTTHFIMSNYEEVGHGVSYLPEKATELIALDIGPVGEGQTSDEFSVSIAAKDKKTPYDFKLRNRLVKLAKANHISYNVDVYRYYASDATQAIHRGADIKYACIGPGTDSTHHYERTHLQALESTQKLLLKYLLE